MQDITTALPKTLRVTHDVGDICLCWPIQVISEKVWREGSLAVIVLLKTGSVIGVAF